MKILLYSLALSFACIVWKPTTIGQQHQHLTHIEMNQQKDSVLRHVVLFKFKTTATPDHIQEIESAFAALPSKIPQIASYEWGLNNSPEGLNKAFTHCFFVTFKSEADRAIYLPHPDHQAFVEILKPQLDDVLVIDYWTR